MTQLPLVIAVKRYSFEDGPGIRSVVFFKGCPLKCIFCHNPEAQSISQEMAFHSHRCIECGNCLKACGQEAVELALPGRIHRGRCTRCGKCADACPTDALRTVGAYYSVEAITELVLRDFEYYRHSGGGITLSGGEPTLFPNYLEGLLRSLKAQGLHIVLETSGYFNYGTFLSKIYPYLDLIYYDLKLVAEEDHVKYCGRPNGVILRNLRLLIDEGRVQVLPRIPLVPGITATEENLSGIVNLLRTYGAEKVLPLPYNPMGLDKFESLGRTRPTLPERFMTPDEIERAHKSLGGNSMSKQSGIIGISAK